MKKAKPYIAAYLVMAKQKPSKSNRWLIQTNRPAPLFRGSWIGTVAGGGYKTRNKPKVSLKNHGEKIPS